MKKIKDRGYWISRHFYIQSLWHWLVNSIRFGSTTFFAVGNPAIRLGGMLSDRKTDFYSLVPHNLLPTTFIVGNRQACFDYLEQNSITFPIIIKPNIGLKGNMVIKMNSIEEITNFFEKQKHSTREWLIQEFVNYKKEFAILCYKYPESNIFGISSFVERCYPRVIADGESTYFELIDKVKNPFLHKYESYKKYRSLKNMIPQRGKEIILDEIGNYSRGSSVKNLNSLLTPTMQRIYKEQYNSIEGLNFFRIDCKSNSIEECMQGKYKILEINGMKGEPLHIYDSNSTFYGNYKTIKTHWRHIREVIKQQSALLKNLPTFAEGIKSWRTLKKEF